MFIFLTSLTNHEPLRSNLHLAARAVPRRPGLRIQTAVKTEPLLWLFAMFAFGTFCHSIRELAPQAETDAVHAGE